jgi:hypothetical protein
MVSTRSRYRTEKAQILYLLNELDGAWDAVIALAKTASRDPTRKRPEFWVDYLHLGKLKPRLSK